MEKKCQICETVFTTYGHRRYCSDACIKEGKRKHNHDSRLLHLEKRLQYGKDYKISHRHPCLICGKPVGQHSTYCRLCNPNLGKGPAHMAWQGGAPRNMHGYIFIYKPEHPRANKRGWVREHLVVWEEAHGKPLPAGWVVHHLNGIRHDNRPRNLIGLPNMKHVHLIAAMAKRIQELEAQLMHQGVLL